MSDISATTKLQKPSYYLLIGLIFTSYLIAPNLINPSYADSIQTDFDAALVELNFDPGNLDGNGIEQGTGNSIQDAIEMALIAEILVDETLDLSNSGGVDHERVHAAYSQALKSANADMQLLLATWPSAARVNAAYAMLGNDGYNFISSMSAAFGAPMNGDYSLALSLDSFLGGNGDADGDGFSNREEYFAFGSVNTQTFVNAALDPQITPMPDQIADLPDFKSTKKTLGIILYPGFEVLDVYGPVEMWGYIPDFNIVMIAEEAGPVMSTQGVATVAEYSFADAPELDIVMVPGGVGTLVQLENKSFIDYLVKVNENTEFTISVCTGSALLAKAGLLRGHRATANKRAFSLSSDQDKEVDWVVEARWVESGKFFTSSGVSAGTDMALGLISSIYGKHAADSLASSVEYEWHDDPTVDPFAQFVPQSALNSLELTFVDTGQGELVEAEPSPDSTLTRSPEYIRLYFDTRPDASLSAVSLDRIGEEANSVSLSQMHTMGNNDLMIRVDDALPDGEYILEWNARFANKVIETTGGYSFVVQSSEL